MMAASSVDNGESIYSDLKYSIDSLRKIVTEGFAKVHTDLDVLRAEFKADIDQVNSSIKDIEKSLSSTQSEVEELKEQFQTEQKARSKDLDALNKKIVDLERRLKQEVENNITLEQYTRRENLRFNNIEEDEREDSKVVVYNILEKELGVDVSNIRFHAVHRIGKKTEGRCRPIIARFVCREDRDRVWSVRAV
ncbi:hypothetical protein ACROYT_G035027 [Oculina patagonica]